MGSMPLQKRPQRAPSPLPPCEDIVRSQLSINQEVGLTNTKFVNALILDFPPSRTVRNKCCLNHLVCSIFITPAQKDKDSST